jgi:glycosyltransferase involved in cell wall biosynthesis
VADISQGRVLFVDQSGELGGAEFSLLDIVRSRACQDKVVVFEDGPFVQQLQEAEADVEVLPLRTKVSRDAGFTQLMAAGTTAWRASQRLARMATSFDIIYANTQKAAVIGAIAARSSRRPMIWHLRDILTSQHFSRLMRASVVRLTNFVATQIIANSEATATAYRSAGGRVPVTVIHNGIDDQPFENALQRKSQLRLKYRSELAAENAPVVAVFGRFSPWKGQHLAIEAIARIPHVHLWCVGNALFGEDEYAQSLHELARQLDVSDRVRFLGFRADVAELMQATDAVLHTSTSPEPFGRVIVEGMLSRRPVIASDAGGAREILSHEENGLLYSMGSVDSLTEAIVRILADLAESELMASAGYHEAHLRFRLADRIAEINQTIEAVALRRASLACA